jgi:hypothetical protein
MLYLKLFPKLCISILLFTIFCSCNHQNDNIDKVQDEVVYISEEFLTDDNKSVLYTAEATVENKKPAKPLNVALTAHHAGYYKNYKRQSEAPEEFAKATVWHAIQMVYSESFSSPQIKVLEVQQDGEKLLLSLQISWRDRWTPKPYVIKGKLTVNSNGDNGKFVITAKNLEAEALELTNPDTKSSLVLPTI